MVEISTTPSKAMEQGLWEELCELKGFNVYAVKEGLMDSDERITLTIGEAAKIGMVISPCSMTYNYSEPDPKPELPGVGKFQDPVIITVVGEEDGRDTLLFVLGGTASGITEELEPFWSPDVDEDEDLERPGVEEIVDFLRGRGYTVYGKEIEHVTVSPFDGVLYEGTQGDWKEED